MVQSAAERIISSFMNGQFVPKPTLASACATLGFSLREAFRCRSAARKVTRPKSRLEVLTPCGGKPHRY